MADNSVPVDYDPFNSYPVDYDPWTGQSPYKALKGYAANLPQRPQMPIEPGAFMPQSPEDIRRMTSQLGTVAQPLMDAAMAPGDYMQGLISKEQAQKRAFDLATMLTGGGLGRSAAAGTAARAASSDSLGVFAGQTAKGADLEAMAAAKRMTKVGVAPKEIYNRTGWWQGADGQWRYEIPDTKAVVNQPELNALSGQSTPLSGVLSHPDLYSAYPDLASRPVVRQPDMRWGGSYMPEFDSFSINPHAADVPGSTLHEVQHAIQQREGFASGGSPEASAYEHPEVDDPASELSVRLSDLRKKYPDAKTTDDIPDLADRARAEAITQGLDKYVKFKEDWGRAHYLHSAGEIEAENVALRYVPGQQIAVSPALSEKLVAGSRGLQPGYSTIATPPYTPPGYTRGPGGFGPLKRIKESEGGGRFHPSAGSTDKAITANTKRDEKVPSVKTHPPDPEVMAAVQQIAGILAKPRINAKYDIPYGWGSNKEGGLTYRDKEIPELIPIKGKPTNVDKYLHIHEQVERILMILLKYPYEHAHKVATSFERAAVEADGIDWIAYETAINKFLEVTEKEKNDKLPPDLFTLAYSKKDLKKFEAK